MKQQQTLAVLGCGWLGLPLGKRLVANGYTVKGSTTTADKLPLLASAGLQAFAITLTADAEAIQAETLRAFLENVSVLCIDIPPKLRVLPAENFVAKIENIIPYIIEAKISRVIFVSSTSVFADQVGFPTITEQTQPNPDTESGKQLWTTEQLLQAQPQFETTVVRFGGLIGPERHPVKHLAGRKNVENPKAPINLIHLEDCLTVLEKLITNDKTAGQTYNVVAPFHPSRETYYTAKAKINNLQAPEFTHTEQQVGKLIEADCISTTLEVTFNTELY